MLDFHCESSTFSLCDLLHKPEPWGSALVDFKNAKSPWHPCVAICPGPGRSWMLGLRGIVAATLLVGAGVGCGGDAEGAALGAADDASRVYFEAFSSFESSAQGATNPLIRFEDPRGTVYSLTAAHLGVDAIHLKLPTTSSCDTIDYRSPEFSQGLECQGEYLSLRGPFRVDLDTRKQGGNRRFWRIPSLDYRRVDVDLAPVSSPTSPLSTLEARASFEADNAIRELAVDFRFHLTLSAVINAPLLTEESLIIGLDVADWLVRIPVTDCLRGGFLKAPHAQVDLDASLDAPTHSYFMYSTPLQNCADAQDRFRSNLINSLRARIDAPGLGGSE